MQIFAIVIIIIILISIFFYLETNILSISHYDISKSSLPSSFNNCRVLQLSDLHNKSFGKNQKRLIKKINKLNPDIIFMTGDMVDRHYKSRKGIISLIKNLDRKYEIYYILGNHEVKYKFLKDLKHELVSMGVRLMSNEALMLERNNEFIYLLGINPPGRELTSERIINKLKTVIPSGSFKIVLSHFPRIYPACKRTGIDLLLSGHTHGGQVIVPFLGPLYVPRYGFFPKYAAGHFYEDGTHLIVSRGLGNNALKTPRIFNRPDIVCITLKKSL